MPKVTYAPLVSDIRGKLGSVYFTNRFGQPVLCNLTSPSNQQSPNRVRQRNIMRTVARWWNVLPVEMKAYCDTLAAAERLSGYDVFIRRNMLDIADFPNPPAPRILPLEAELPLIVNMTVQPYDDPRYLMVSYDGPQDIVDCVTIVLICETAGGEFVGPMLYNRFLWWDFNNFLIYMTDIKPDTTYTVFGIIANSLLTKFGPAESCLYTSPPA